MARLWDKTCHLIFSYISRPNLSLDSGEMHCYKKQRDGWCAKLRVHYIVGGNPTE